jgi:hypothetical protein
LNCASIIELGRKAIFARCLHRRVTAFGVQLTHDAMHMICHGEFGMIQAGRDFLVGETTHQQARELLLP